MWQSSPHAGRAIAKTASPKKKGTDMESYFVVGDIHEKAGMLENWWPIGNRQSQLVFLGDLIDRGEDSRKVIELVKDVVEQQGPSASLNHWIHVSSLIDNPTEHYDHYRRNGDTINFSTWSSPHGLQ